MEITVVRLVEELVRKSGEEIGYNVTQEDVDMVLLDIENEFGITVDDDTELNCQVITAIADTVMKWERDTKENF